MFLSFFMQTHFGRWLIDGYPKVNRWIVICLSKWTYHEIFYLIKITYMVFWTAISDNYGLQVSLKMLINMKNWMLLSLSLLNTNSQKKEEISLSYQYDYKL